LHNPLLDIDYKGATGALIHVIGGPDMTLEDINKVGELVTESLDRDANVIWGARVADDMKGKITVMTIITGVKSTCILGRPLSVLEPSPEVQEITEELGIEVIDE
jgi:cell division protein FtsZ